jgi:hypothetical protein
LAVEAVDLGPKLSRRTVAPVVAGFGPWLLRLLALLRREHTRAGPVDVLLVHYKKEQLMAALVPRRLARSVVWAEYHHGRKGRAHEHPIGARTALAFIE